MLFVITGISHPQMLPWREKQFSLLFELKRLLDQAMTRLVKKAYNIMIHQFLVGLPESMSQQLQVIGDTGNSDRLPEKAKIMITAMEQERVSAIAPKESEDYQVKEQIAGLTEQVAALTIIRRKQFHVTILFASRWVIFSVTTSQ